MIVIRHSTVVFLTCSSYRVNRRAVISLHREALSQLSNLCENMDLELISAPKVASSDKEMTQNLDFLARRHPMCLILHYAGWTEDETVLKIICSFDCPLILWATRDIFKDGISQLVSHVGYMEAASFLKQSGHDVFRFYGGPDESSAAALRCFLTASRTFHALKNLKFGWIGQGYGARGILDSSFDELLLQEKLGIEFHRISLEEFFSLYRKTPLCEEGQEEKFCSKFGLNTPKIRAAKGIDAPVADDSLRLLRSLSQIVDDYHLDALSLRCFPEFKENGVPTPCLAISAMNNVGIPASCEGDVLAGISMFILSRLSNSPSTMMDIFSYDERQSTMDLFHCGCAPASLVTDTNTVVYKTHCKPQVHRAGITVEFPVKEGEVSFVKLDSIQGRFSLYSFSGKSIAPSSFLRGNQATIRTKTPVKTLIEQLIDEGVSHHMIMSMGTVGKEAKFLAQMAGFRFISM